MAPSGTHVLAQGTTRTIDVTGIVDANNQPLDVTGWAVRAVARRNTVSGEVVAAWASGTPAAGEGQATTDAAGVHLTVTPAMSDAWGFDVAILHCEITEPVSPFREERIADVTITNDRTTVRA